MRSAPDPANETGDQRVRIVGLLPGHDRERRRRRPAGTGGPARPRGAARQRGVPVRRDTTSIVSRSSGIAGSRRGSAGPPRRPTRSASIAASSARRRAAREPLRVAAGGNDRSRRRHGRAEHADGGVCALGRRQPGRDPAGAVLEQLAIGVDPLGAGGQGRRRSSRSSCWPTASTRRPAPAARRWPHAVVGPGGQVDDHRVDAGRGSPRDRSTVRTGTTAAARGPDEVGQPGRPDQVVGQDRDAQASAERSGQVVEDVARGDDARSAARRSTIGMCRKPPTAILWIATAIGSSWRRTTGSGVMKSRDVECLELLAGHLQRQRRGR